ncbi:hypothetical protein OZK63_35640 [Streptomyces sp. UMAF16]|nr:hypothetical protein [Streptomyces sp. UMAF16]
MYPSPPGAVDVALYTTASVDAVVPAHPEVGWEQLRDVEKGRRSPLASLRPEPGGGIHVSLPEQRAALAP